MHLIIVLMAALLVSTLVLIRMILAIMIALAKNWALSHFYVIFQIIRSLLELLDEITFTEFQSFCYSLIASIETFALDSSIHSLLDISHYTIYFIIVPLIALLLFLDLLFLFPRNAHRTHVYANVLQFLIVIRNHNLENRQVLSGLSMTTAESLDELRLSRRRGVVVDLSVGVGYCVVLRPILLQVKGLIFSLHIFYNFRFRTH